MIDIGFSISWRKHPNASNSTSCAYVLMPNHYHLLMRTRQPNLSKAMQWLGVSYTVHYNRGTTGSGISFQGRFKSILVQNAAYMLQLSCYIHRNPVRAGPGRAPGRLSLEQLPRLRLRQSAGGWLSTD